MIYGSDQMAWQQRELLQQAAFGTRVYNRGIRVRLLLEYAATVGRFCRSAKGSHAVKVRDVAAANRLTSLRDWLRQEWSWSAKYDLR